MCHRVGREKGEVSPRADDGESPRPAYPIGAPFIRAMRVSVVIDAEVGKCSGDGPGADIAFLFL